MKRNPYLTAIGALLILLFTGGPVRNHQDATGADHQRYGRFFHHMLGRGVYLPPSGYELWTLSTTHGPDEIAAVLYAAAAFSG